MMSKNRIREEDETMLRRYIAVLVAPVLAVVAISDCEAQGPRPEDFNFARLEYAPPNPADFRTELPNGLVVYIAEDHDIPWFDATLLVKTGPFLEPRDKLGVESLTEDIMREGGTTAMTGEEIDERMDFLAGSVSATSLSIHMRHIDEGLRIWTGILTNPAFPEDKLRRQKERLLVAIQNRNKNVSSVGNRTFGELVYGENSPITALQTEAMVNGLEREDLVEWHRKYWGANNAILVVAGDFDRAEMVRKLEEAFGAWRTAEDAEPPIPEVTQVAEAGVYMVEPEVIPNQGVIRIGHLGLMQDHPDYPAVDLMNYILGGGSFSSRITRSVRVENGLAYSTGSRFLGGTFYPGTFVASCQTKNSTVVFAAQLMLDEIETIRNERVPEEDLEFARAARINAFPALITGGGGGRGGSSSAVFGMLRNYARLEFDGRPMDYYSTYVERYEQVTRDDIRRVAQQYLRPENLIIMVAGNIEESRAGADRMLPNQQKIDEMAAKFNGRTIDGLAARYGDGNVHILELRTHAPALVPEL
jgi:predicted Zn-dependent peptidase